MTLFRLALFSSLGGLALAAPHQTRNPDTDACTREALKAHTDTLIAAQTSGDPAPLIALQSSSSPEFVYTEDFKSNNLSTSVLRTALKIDHHRSLLDTTQCATYTEIISASDPSTPRVIGTQMRFDATASKLIKIETLVTQPGDWLFNASATLRYARQEDSIWVPIPEAERDTREVIQAAGDAYLDLFNNKSVVVPWGTPCQRLEGGAYTGRGLPTDSCNVGVPSGVPITNRRYVIDEVLGSVDAFVQFATRPDSHEFRVEKGKLRLVHTLTVMRN
ncbi:hypothetical protein V8F20_004392 [Naviculisporaceae sp. PSN 640]